MRLRNVSQAFLLINPGDKYVQCDSILLETLKLRGKSFLILLEVCLFSLVSTPIGELKLKDTFGESLWVCGTWVSATALRRFSGPKANVWGPCGTPLS